MPTTTETDAQAEPFRCGATTSRGRKCATEVGAPGERCAVHRRTEDAAKSSAGGIDPSALLPEDPAEMTVEAANRFLQATLNAAAEGKLDYRAPESFLRVLDPVVGARGEESNDA